MKVTKPRALYLPDSLRFSIMLIAVLSALTTVFSAFYDGRIANEASPTSASVKETPTVILDPGHGGMDSGAVSIYGDEEKHLNLALTKKVGAFLESAGIRVIYTRSEDTMVESEIADGSRKNRDLMGRVEAARKEPDALFVSIHMNTLPIEKYKGLQVFYSDRNDANRPLAQVVQNTVIASLQPDNNRAAKNAEGKIFILDRIDQPAILIECGFLTNAEEANLLKDELYQAKLAYVLTRPILDFLAER